MFILSLLPLAKSPSTQVLYKVSSYEALASFLVFSSTAASDLIEFAIKLNCFTFVFCKYDVVQVKASAAY